MCKLTTLCTCTCTAGVPLHRLRPSRPRTADNEGGWVALWRALHTAWFPAQITPFDSQCGTCWKIRALHLPCACRDPRFGCRMAWVGRLSAIAWPTVQPSPGAHTPYRRLEDDRYALGSASPESNTAIDLICVLKALSSFFARDLMACAPGLFELLRCMLACRFPTAQLTCRVSAQSGSDMQFSC